MEEKTEVAIGLQRIFGSCLMRKLHAQSIHA